MLSIKINNQINKFTDNHSARKLETTILKQLYKSNIGLEHPGINDIQLRGYKKVINSTSSSMSFSLALQNLKFKGLVDYIHIVDTQYDQIRLTNIGRDYCRKNCNNRILNYLFKNHLAIIAIIVSVIALLYK